MSERVPSLDDLRATVAAFARRLDGMEEDRREDGVLVRQIAAKLGIGVLPVDEETPDGDVVIHCKCGSKVGYYDRTQDFVRVRYREHLVWMRLGVGGEIAIVCRACSAIVPVTYTPPDKMAVAEVRDGLLVLDTPTLMDLLQQAVETPGGHVTLRVGAGSVTRS